MKSVMDLHHGDCIVIMGDLIKKGVKVDMILTDLPYGVTSFEWDTVIDTVAMWSRIKGLSKPTTPTLLFGIEPFASKIRMSNIKDYKYDWYWKKSRPAGFAYAKNQPMRTIENISVFYKKKPFYDSVGEPYEKVKGRIQRHHTPNDENGFFLGGGVGYIKEPIQYTHKRKKNFLEFNSLHNSKKVIQHPTQKPTDLLEYLIKTYTNEGDTVLDFTAGSFSTGVACKNLNRNFIGIEINEHFYNIGLQKLKEL